MFTPRSHAPAVANDQEVLCQDVRIGRCGRTHLAVDMDFYHRSTAEWGGPVTVQGGGWRLSGIFLELSVQVRLRHWVPLGDPVEWVNHFDGFGAPSGPWPLDRFRPRRGVLVADLLRLAELSRAYNRNLRIDPERDVARATFIPRADETDLRAIAARLRASRPPRKVFR